MKLNRNKESRTRHLNKESRTRHLIGTPRGAKVSQEIGQSGDVEPEEWA